MAICNEAYYLTLTQHSTPLGPVLTNSGASLCGQVSGTGSSCVLKLDVGMKERGSALSSLAQTPWKLLQ